MSLQYYIEIRLHPSEEIPLSFLLTKTFSILHTAMSRVSTDGKCPVGVSFPRFDEKALQVGDIIRLFAKDRATLEHMQLPTALARYADYLTLKDIRPVPHTTQHATYSKVHAKLSNSQIRRYARRKGISEAEAFAIYHAPKQKHTPYIRLHSHSTGQDYMLLLRKTTRTEEKEGTFTTLGLSPETTVPAFPTY